jgi:hypothetical protein
MDFKAGNGLNNKNNLDTEKSFLESLESKYKTTYFWSFFVLLKEEDNSIIFSYSRRFDHVLPAPDIPIPSERKFRVNLDQQLSGNQTK